MLAIRNVLQALLKHVSGIRALLTAGKWEHIIKIMTDWLEDGTSSYTKEKKRVKYCTADLDDILIYSIEGHAAILWSIHKGGGAPAALEP
eukprot:4569581-Amphidinium_carterae.1